jgi:hypothetical protein
VRSFDEDAEAQGLVHPLFPVVDALQRQAGLKVATVALLDAEGADDVVRDLVAAAPEAVVHRAGVVLEVDPVRHDHRRGHDELERALGGVVAVAVVVQKDASAEVEVPRAFARRGDESGISGETPLWPCLRPVAAALMDELVELGLLEALARPRLAARCWRQRLEPSFEPKLELHEIGLMRERHFVGVEERDRVGGGVVQRGDEARVVRNLDAFTFQGTVRTIRLIEDGGGDAGIRVARMASAGTAVESGGVGIVRGVAAVTAEHDEAAEIRW